MLTQATTSTITIRGPQPVPPITHFLVQVAHPTGDYFPESTLTETNRDCVVNDIAGGVHTHPVRRVLAFEVGGKCWDASTEIAKDVLAQAIDIYGIDEMPRDVCDFIEEILGVYAIPEAWTAAA